ncbi:efflux transporter outer membrane subunit [Singulisphaera acidiphila]|uniref:Efflux transporter, outer membrane factor lipoprotein, NodT family n=1 Tax=Singulisphaera acidiphila (strain ATCC BAA-1392 / DSM 18658 / VKM B-2454 / MOB10) TaxID=886293 RepID=L0DEN2_SINAD|nr:efflux transporter outer membrane subunit [Singulisphaera acidiphila]AGA27278.1 efflux transporter, outer membrane factor lipoprotein, NodT family [Singulisphaera acidiphila DSM 18658]
MDGRLPLWSDDRGSVRRGRQAWSTPAVLLVALVVGSGCGTTSLKEYVHNGLKLGPNYGRPPAPVAPAWIEAENPAVRNAPLESDDWWSVFSDPTLTTLIQRSYEQNPTLRVVGARVLEARAGQAIAVGNIFPQSQQALGSYARVNLSPNLPPFNSLAAALPANSVPLSFSNWFFGFNLSWELDLWGRIRRNVESTNATLDASVEDYDAALVTLFADIASNYVQYRVSQQRIKIAQSNVQIQEQVLSLADQKFRVGTTTRLDVEQAKTVLEQTRSTIPALQIQLGQANDALCILLGTPPHDLEPELGPGADLGGSPVPNTPTWVATGIPADLLRRRPDIRSAERQVAAQSAQIGVAEADLYPTLFINGTIGWDAEDFSKAFSTKSFLGLLLPGFRWNVLNYGRIQNNIHLQQARTEELIATYQSRVLSAGREVQVSLRGFLRSQEQTESLRRSVEAAAAASQVGLSQYKTGTIDFNRVFNLETTQVQQQDRLATAQGEIALNLISVYRALGGGWEYRLREAETPATMPAPPSAVATPVAAPRPAAPPEPVRIPEGLDDPSRPSPVEEPARPEPADALPPALP